MSFFNHRNNLIHAAIAAALSTINIYIVLSLEPPNLAQGIFGNIFYIHVPVAWTAFLLYLCVMISGILFLKKKNKVWDRRGLAFAEVGTIFMFLVLTTGPIWAKPAWGIFWPWEPRLTTSLILFLIFLGYFMFLTGSALFLSKETRTAMLENMKNDSFIMVMGYITLLIGLPFVILHNVWELTVLGLVTLIGWLTLAKGFVFLLKPSIIKKKDYSDKNLKTRGVITALLGLGLMYCGYYPYWF